MAQSAHFAIYLTVDSSDQKAPVFTPWLCGSSFQFSLTTAEQQSLRDRLNLKKVKKERVVRSECVCRREKGKGGGDSSSGWRETWRTLFYDRNLFDGKTQDLS